MIARTGLVVALALPWAAAAQPQTPVPADGRASALAAEALTEPERIVVSEPLDETLVVTRGARFEVRLSEQLGTGYRWMLDAADAAAPVLAVEGEAELADASGEGASSLRAFTIRAEREGEAELAFAYRRPFGSPAPAKTWRVRVLVTAP